MTFTVNDFSDLLQIVETHPKWRRKLIKVLFPEIDVPKALQELAEAQRRTEEGLQRLEASFAQSKAERDASISLAIAERKNLSENMAAGFAQAKTEREAGFAHAASERQSLSERMAAGFAQAKTEREAGFAHAASERRSLSERVEAGFAHAASERQSLSERVEAGFAQAKTERNEMKTDIKGLRHDVNKLKGLQHEQFYRDKANAIFGIYLAKGRNVTDKMAQVLHIAKSEGKISHQEHIQVLAADLLWGGQLHGSKEKIVLVLEASWTAEVIDVERAVNRAEILRRVGVKALAIVGGQEWEPQAAKMARKQKVITTNNGRIDDDSWQNALSHLL